MSILRAGARCALRIVPPWLLSASHLTDVGWACARGVALSVVGVACAVGGALLHIILDALIGG
jgi:hypothetical protein